MNYIIHLDKYLNIMIENYGIWVYLLFFLIIFCETGLVVTPFLPGDSLLFAAGTFAALGGLHLEWATAALFLGAVAGDSLNYWIGNYLGPRAFSGRFRFLKKEYLERTNQFYQRHGGKTIVLARFIPIIRTFAPFVAGIGKMKYPRFFSFNVLGGFIWVMLFVLGGFLFGNLPIIKHNFSLVILVIILTSVVPGIIEFVRTRLNSSFRERPAE